MPSFALLCTAVCMSDIVHLGCTLSSARYPKRCARTCYHVLYSVNLMARKNPAAVALGRKGGKNSRKNLSPEQRTVLAKKAAATRWKGKKRAQ